MVCCSSSPQKEWFKFARYTRGRASRDRGLARYGSISTAAAEASKMEVPRNEGKNQMLASMWDMKLEAPFLFFASPAKTSLLGRTETNTEKYTTAEINNQLRP